MKKRKVSKTSMKKLIPKIKIKSIGTAWESTTWASQAPIVFRHPAWHVGKSTCHLDLVKGFDCVTIKHLNNDNKLIARFVQILVNKYYSKGKPITPEISHEIFISVKRFIILTTDIFEKL